MMLFDHTFIVAKDSGAVLPVDASKKMQIFCCCCLYAYSMNSMNYYASKITIPKKYMYLIALTSIFGSARRGGCDRQTSAIRLCSTKSLISQHIRTFAVVQSHANVAHSVIISSAIIIISML